MGLLQKAAETYENMSKYVGVATENRTALPPIGYLTTKAAIEVRINADGCFISSCLSDEKVIIPVTEKSAGRASVPCAHPLCDQLGYLSGEDEKKYQLYVEQLHEWCISEFCNPKAKAILAYIQKKTLVSDLVSDGTLKKEPDGTVNAEKAAKDLVVFRVFGCDGENAVWKDTVLMKDYSDYYLSRIADKPQTLCYVSGKQSVPADQHIKGVVSINGNAKIISANDKTNFTYLGRFQGSEEAAEVSYEMSQKAHNALKWIIENDGVSEGTRVFVCWNPKGKTVKKLSDSLWDDISEEQELSDPTHYHEALRKVLWSYKANFEPDDQVITAAFDAATTGRLSVTYYNEFGASDFFDRLFAWDETCCFSYAANKVSSPSLRRIVDVAFGTQHGNDERAKLEVDKRVSAQQLGRLFTCRLEATSFPTDILRSAVNKCSNLLCLNKDNRRTVLFTTCAMIRKYRHDHFREEWNMALEREKTDRSYQFGRLLAVMEKAESETYENDDTKRETNAIRLQSVFVKRPGYATEIVLKNLKTAYYPRLKPGRKVYFEKLIGEIMSVISDCGEQAYDKPLEETYLLGYYLQKNDFYKKTSASDADESEQ